MTAVFAGMIALGGAFWLAELTRLIELPNAAWSMGLSDMSGELAKGMPVTLTDGATPATEIATGIVQNVTSHAGTSATAIIGQIKQSAGHFITNSKQLTWSGSGVGSAMHATVGAQTGIPIFNPTYLWIGVMTVAGIAGAFFVYWIVGRNAGSVDFLVAVDGEMKKVNWSTKRIIQNSTTVVILSSFFIAGALFLIDNAFGNFFQLIGVMPK